MDFMLNLKQSKEYLAVFFWENQLIWAEIINKSSLLLCKLVALTTFIFISGGRFSKATSQMNTNYILKSSITISLVDLHENWVDSMVKLKP
jgi:hypothetical protein